MNESWLTIYGDIMAFDGLYLHSITKELKESILNSRADKVHQPEKDEIILNLRGREGNHRLLLTSTADHARVHLSKEAKQNPNQPPLFTMVLRKYLQGGRLVEIQQPQGDRILNLTFEVSDEMGFNSNYHLISEMMGRHSNILLVRERDQKIMECIKHVGADMNTYRLLLPGAEYIPPPAQNKLNPVDFSDKELLERLPSEFSANDFSKLFSGISRMTSQLLYTLYQDQLKNQLEPVAAIRWVLNKALAADTFYIFIKKNMPIDISLVLPSEEFLAEYDEIEEFSSPSEALEFFFAAKDRSNRVRQRSQDILRIIDANVDRVERKIEILEEVLAEASTKDDFLNQGELIKANLYALKDGMDRAKVINFYDEDQAEIEIKLDPNKSITANMQKFFNQYNKYKRSEEKAKEQLLLAKEELSYLNSVADSVMRSEDPSDIADIRQELIVAGYIRFKSSRKKRESPSKPMRFKSTEGYTIYVGKNNNQNDFLTTKLADPYDTWLHTKDYPGSHVIIKGSGFSDETLLEAANLAAWHSKAQTGSKVPVDYTLVRHVKKPNGAKPGMVIYVANKTVYVDPGLPRLERF